MPTIEELMSPAHRESAGDKRAFVTGSHKYGTPREDSDFDLVVFLGGDDLDRMRETFEPDAPGYGYVLVLRFGVLNLICFCDERKYEAWREGTEKLEKIKPVDRSTAVALIGGLLTGTKPLPQETVVESAAQAAGRGE